MAEVLVSITVLAIGMMSIAMLITRTLGSGTRSRFLNMASVLASEKLDNLNTLGSTDPNMAGGGSLTGPTDCAAGDSYCDEVTVSESSGADYETQTLVQIVGGVTVATTSTIVHTSTGCIDTPANCGVANAAAGGSTFTRRWLITQDPVIGGAVVTGVRRITVIVRLDDGSVKPPVSFQMSMVRP